MKTLTSILILFACGLFAENVAVRFLHDDPRNEFHSVPGCPTNWPVAIAPANTSLPFYTVIDLEELNAIYASRGSTFTNWHRTAYLPAVRAKAEQARNAEALKRAERAAIRSELRGKTNVTPAEAAAILEKVLALMRLDEELGD